MALKVNEKAPDFTLPSTSGKDFTLDITAYNKPCIIYFYPKDFTPGCTLQACEFRDTFSFFKTLNIAIYGISRDSIATHLEFKKAHHLPFELLADEKGIVADAYKAFLSIIKFTRRITYLLDKDHKIVAAYENLFAATNHIKKMVENLNPVQAKSLRDIKI